MMNIKEMEFFLNKKYTCAELLEMYKKYETRISNNKIVIKALREARFHNSNKPNNLLNSLYEEISNLRRKKAEVRELLKDRVPNIVDEYLSKACQ